MNKSPTLEVPALTRAEHEAIKNLCNGEATPDQQVTAVAVIVHKFAEPQELSYIPGSFDETAFLAGRRFIASLIRKYKTIKVSETKEEGE